LFEKVQIICFIISLTNQDVFLPWSLTP